MRLVFAGTPEFAERALAALIDAGHPITLVLTRPDRPGGRGQRTQPSPVKRRALAHDLPLFQPPTLRDPAVQQRLRDTVRDNGAQLMVVAAYGLLLPPAVLEIPPLGCVNIHASLLPRWRGAAPIQRALLAGDRETGISIMQMDEGLDTGPVLLREAIPIASDDTAQTLHDRLAALGAELIVRALASRCEAVPQDEAAATYAAKIDKREAVIDWREAAETIERKVRAFDPTPGAATSYRGVLLKIWRATAEAHYEGEAGSVRAADQHGIVVAAGAGSLRITEIQRAGGKRLAAAAFLAGCPVQPGERLGD